MRETNGGLRLRATALALAALLLLTACGGVREEGGDPAQPGSPQQAATAESGQPDKQGAKGPTRDQIKPFAGYRAPDFTAVDVFTGEQVTLADLRGQVVFLNFWATWCPPCKAEMPEMEALHREMGDQVRIVALGADARESAEKMGAFAEAMGLTFTVAYDKGAAMEAYQVAGVPTSFFIDKEGNLHSRYPGAMKLEQMKRFITEAEKGVEAASQ